MAVELNKKNTIMSKAGNYIIHCFDDNSIIFKRGIPHGCIFVTPPGYEISNIENNGELITVTKINNLSPLIENNISDKLKEKVQDLKEVIVKSSENNISKKITSTDDDNSTILQMINVPTTAPAVAPTTAVALAPTSAAAAASAVALTTTTPIVAPATTTAITAVPTTAVAPTTTTATTAATAHVVPSLTNNSSNNLVLLLKSSLVDLIDSARSVATYTDKVYMLKHILKYIGQEYDMDRTVIITNEQEIKLKFGQIITTLSTSSLSHLCGVLVVAMI